MSILLTWQASLPSGKSFALGDAVLPGSFRPLMQPTLECQSAILGVPGTALRPTGQQTRDEYAAVRSNIPSAAEVYTDGTALFVVMIRVRVQGRAATAVRRAKTEELPSVLLLTYFGPPDHAIAADEVKAALETAATVPLEPLIYRSHQFDELRAEGRETTQQPAENERLASEILRDRSTRALVTAIKTSGGLLLRDLPRQLPSEDRDRTDTIRETLHGNMLIDSEVVVICGKSQTQTARVPSRQILVESSARGMKCACGRPIADERVEEALTITEFGRNLLDKSRWLTLIVVAQLLRLGVQSDHILIEQQVGGDEVDCVANIRGQLVLFELKDKEFNLGSAYSFGAKIGILRPAHAVIVSTEHVGGDAKEHFQRSRLAQSAYSQRYLVQEEPGTDIQYVEGVDNIDLRIAEIVGSIYARSAVTVLEQVLPLAFPSPQAIIQRFEGAA
jgi:hypothetical protein